MEQLTASKAIDPIQAQQGSFALQFHRHDAPANIDEVVVPIALRIEEFDGDYDGWGCGVVD
jgi:hypothetical protein